MKLAPNFTLPNDAASRTIGVLGQKGSGKTYLAMKLAEVFLDAGVQIVCLDPTGVWWGLKAEGTGPGFSIIVMGGDHADITLAHTSGAVVAEFIVQSGHSVVLDLSHFTSNGQQDQFVCEFAERLYRLKAMSRTSLHLMLDEADSFAPQTANRRGMETRMLGAIEAIVRRGRSRGLGMTMVSQRPAVLNKNVLEQVDLLVAMRVTGKNDHKALSDWTRIRGTAEQQKRFMDELAGQPNGTGFFWSPEWLNCFQQHRVSARRTFDSSKTPEPGARIVKPKLAHVDLTRLTAEIEATVEQAKANDPKELQHTIATLKAKVGTLEKAKPQPEVERVEVPVLGEMYAPILKAVDALRAELQGISDQLHYFRNRAIALQGRTVIPKSSPAPERASSQQPRMEQKPAPTNGARSGAGENSKLGKCERAILTVLAQYHPEACLKRKVSLVSQYSITSSTFQNSLGSLRSKGFIQGSDPLNITGLGLDALGPFDPLPTGREAIECWATVLGKCERSILQVFLDAPHPVLKKETIAELSSYSITSSSFQNALGALRTRGLLEGRDPITLLIP